MTQALLPTLEDKIACKVCMKESLKMASNMALVDKSLLDSVRTFGNQALMDNMTPLHITATFLLVKTHILSKLMAKVSSMVILVDLTLSNTKEFGTIKNG